MIQKRQLFILVSQTQTGIARLIRSVSHYPYNHVSLTLDPSLTKWYSFARYVQDVPLHGGLVSESPERLCAPDGDIQVRLYRVKIPVAKAAELERMLEYVDDPESGLIYNHFDAVASACGFRLQLPGCHTCLSFACEILDQQHISIASLCNALEPNLIYEGSLNRLVSVTESREEAYFAPVGMLTGAVKCAAQLGVLTTRTIRYGTLSHMAAFFRRTI